MNVRMRFSICLSFEKERSALQLVTIETKYILSDHGLHVSIDIVLLKKLIRLSDRFLYICITYIENQIEVL